MEPKPTFWTIGHATADVEHLLTLLRAQGIDVVADVRSTPYSKYVPQANREVLAAAVEHAGMEYLFCGDALGGRPAEESMLRANGKPDYQQMAAAPAFEAGLQYLLDLSASSHVCLLCSEEDPARCHRSLLVAESLVGRGCEVKHLRHDGTIETHAEMHHRRTGGQLSLF